MQELNKTATLEMPSLQFQTGNTTEEAGHNYQIGTVSLKTQPNPSAKETWRAALSPNSKMKQFSDMLYLIMKYIERKYLRFLLKNV